MAHCSDQLRKGLVSSGFPSLGQPMTGSQGRLFLSASIARKEILKAPCHKNPCFLAPKLEPLPTPSPFRAPHLRPSGGHYTDRLLLLTSSPSCKVLHMPSPFWAPSQTPTTATHPWEEVNIRPPESVAWEKENMMCLRIPKFLTLFFC